MELDPKLALPSIPGYGIRSRVRGSSNGVTDRGVIFHNKGCLSHHFLRDVTARADSEFEDEKHEPARIHSSFKLCKILRIMSP